MRPSHSIRKQTLEVEVDSEASALALQPRLGDFNRRRLVRVIERVLDELDLAGRHVRLGRIEIDLGTLSLADFEAAAEQRLERELRGALADAVREAVQQPSGARRALDENEARRELLAHHLEHGTLPFWGPRAQAFALADLVARMAESDPRGLVAVVRRVGHQAHVLERLVAQLGEPQLQGLIGLLEPQHAALIVAYVDDLRQVHRVEPILALGTSEFARALWLLTQAYLVRDAGTQFNRRSFVKSLLEGLAMRAGLHYRDLLATLRLGLERTRRRHALHASFPALIGELLREAEGDAATSGQHPVESAAPGPGAVALACLERCLATDDASVPAGGLTALLSGLDAPGRALVRRRLRELAAAGRHERIGLAERLLRGAPPGELLAFLAPAQRADLAALPGLCARAGVRLAATSGARADWRRAAWRALVAALLDAGPGRSALHAVLRRTLEHMADAAAATPDTLAGALIEVRQRGRATPALERGLRAARDELRRRRPSGRPAAGVFGRYEQVDLLRHFARHGRLPWRALLRTPGLTVERALRALFTLPPALLRAVFDADDSAERLAGLTRVARALAPEELARLLARLLPQAAQGTPLRAAIDTFASQAGDPGAFVAGAIAAALDGRDLDLEELAQAGRGSSAPTAPDTTPREAPALKSALSAALHEGHDAATAVALVQALQASHPDDALQFLRALRDAAGPRAALLRAAPDALFGELLALVCPGEAASLKALQEALLALPSPYRPRPDEVVREALFEVALQLEAGQRLTPVALARLLRRLFTPSVPEPVMRFLAQRRAEWSRARALPAPHLAAFEAALRVAWRAGDDGPVAPDQGVVPRWSPALREAVFAFLLEEHAPAPRPAGVPGRPAARFSEEELGHALEELLEVARDDVRVFVLRHTEDAQRREHWARVLSEAALVRLTHLLEPRRPRVLLDAAEVLASAWHASLPPGHKTLARRQAFWTFVLEFLARSAPAERSLERLAASFSEFFAARYRAAAPSRAGRDEVGARLLEQAGRLARAAGNGALLAVLQRGRARLLLPWQTSPAPQQTGAVESGGARSGAESRRERPAEERRRPAFGRERAGDADDAEPIYVDNAGLVLAGAFLPHLFQTLDLLAPDGKGRQRLRDAPTASRAVHLLQFLVDGRTSAPEPLLALNKVLCGLAPSAPVEREAQLSEREVELAEKLLRAMLANWKILTGTSVAGLRETFLQREGRLQRKSEGWRLHVQRKTLDVLVDQVPWSISVILHAWMPEPVHVTW